MSHIYRIRIEGHLDLSWANWFDELTLVLQEDGTTLLTGSVEDQPALHGLLTKIHNLGLPLLLVEQIEIKNNSKNKEKNHEK
ncbi:MAG: hypothetical protein GY796_31345 [Chloroflexi bacterium]|nr:hypothetical protein [Chloroflexota bacterium]